MRRKRDWRQFHRFAERFERITGSAYHTALILDPDLAVQSQKARKSGKLKKTKNPPAFRFTAEMHRLTDIADILYKQAVANARGDIDAAYMPRPLTADDYLDLAVRQKAMDRTIATFFPAHVRLTPKVNHR